MNWIAENWLILLFGGGMLAMHLFGHGHGSHAKKGAPKKGAPSPDEISDATFEQSTLSSVPGPLGKRPKIDLGGSVEHVDFTAAKPENQVPVQR